MATQSITRTGFNIPWLRVLNLTAFIAVIVVNALANILPINGVTTGDLSDNFPTLFTPAGYVFSIWGLIYSLLLVFSIYQLLPAQRDNPRIERMTPWFLISSVFNIAWIFAWHYQLILLSWVLMLGILGSLIMVYQSLGTGQTSVSRSEWLALRLPFSVYLGWITVATVANTSVELYHLGFTGGVLAAPLTVVALIAATAIASLMLFRRYDIAYTLVPVWAFAGIAYKQWGAEPLVVWAAISLAVALVALIAVRTIRGRQLPAAA